MLCILALSCFFLAQVQHGGGPALDRDDFPCKRLFCLLQKVWQKKKQRSVDCVEADKKTVQAQRNEGRGFLPAG